MIDTRFETTIDLRGEIENYRQVALIKYYKILLELDPRRDRLTMLAVIRCIDKLERHSQERKRPRNDKKKMLAEGTLAWHYQKRNQLFRKAGLYDIESTQFLVDHEEIFDTHEEREERERFEACRREALRRKTETHPQPLSPLSGSIWCGAPAGNPIGEPAPDSIDPPSIATDGNKSDGWRVNPLNPFR